MQDISGLESIVIMFIVFILLCALIWLPIMGYLFVQRTFTILLIWLLIAPIATYLVRNLGGSQVLFSTEVQQETNIKEWNKNGYLVSDTTFRLKEILEPNRLLFTLLFVVILLDALFQKRHQQPLNQTEIWMGILTLILLASVVLQSRRIAFGMRVVSDAFVIPFVAYFVTRRLVRCERDLYQLIKVLGFMGLYLILIGTLERLVNPDLTYRLQGLFLFRDGFYFVMMIVFFTTLPELFSADLKGRRPVFPLGLLKGMLACIVAIIILIWTRACWLGFSCGLWTLAFWGRHLIPERQKLIGIGLTLTLLPLLAFVGYELVTSIEAISNRVGNVEYILSRLLTYQRIWAEIVEHPIFGIGFHNLLDALQDQWEVNGLKSYVNTHQSYLAILAEMGIAGMVAYSAIVICLFRTGLEMRRRPTHPLDQWRGVCLVAMLVAYLVPPMTDSTLYKPLVSHTYLFMWSGAMAALHPVQRLASRPALYRPPQSPHVLQRRWPSMAKR